MKCKYDEIHHVIVFLLSHTVNEFTWLCCTCVNYPIHI